ncbi:hypothetical protein AB1Y20_020143 [Prymnesium parvum]|uniref:Uncharacterized protein n=1 Tax=Prymnesium parvum TaxID=97485 RepID=A0AB34JX93_PRYPA
MAAAACAWNQPLPVLLGRPAVSPLVDRTFLHFGGLPHAFAPLEPLRIPGEDVATAAFLENCTVRANDTSPWARAAAEARAGGPLRLVVLGTSPTTGCGSAEDVTIAAYEPGPQHNRSMGFSRRCDPTRSWGRHLRDFLVRLLGPLAPEVSIKSKNAASAVWFARCCRERVPHDAHVVLLEVLTNVFGSDLKALIRAVRRAAPSAAIAFVMWPSFGSMRTHRDWPPRTRRAPTPSISNAS